VLNSPIRSPLDGRYAHHIARPLDLDNLQQGSGALIGVHDFAPFGQPTQGESTVREVFDAQWQQDGPWFTFDVAGNAFLRGMVRCMVGTLLRIGGGLWPVERTAELLESRNRALVAPPAPACGLCLMRVEY
jgi:tRNA pseudouridine38-40 synthase